MGWIDPEDPDTWFLPPLGQDRGGLAQRFQLDHPIFAGFPGMMGNERSVHLDNQYVYDAYRFLDLSGSEWKVYRKNIRKYPNRVGGELNYRRVYPGQREEEVASLLERWAEGRTIQDPETFVRFVLFGTWRWGLFRDGVLVGLNVGDVNSAHGVFRYCIDDGTPYLNEYLRHRFFTSTWAREVRWINDGGDLGNPGLAKFKWKLNPFSVTAVFSHKP